MASDTIDTPKQPEPEFTGTDLHPCQVPGYEPKFDRLGTHRRVLGHVTDEVDVDAMGPRNTLEALSFGLMTDTNTPGVSGSLSEASASTKDCLDDLVDAGLLKNKSGKYEVTAAGLTELRN